MGHAGLVVCNALDFRNGLADRYIYGVHTVFLAWKSPNLRCIYTCLYTVLANPTHTHTHLRQGLEQQAEVV